MEKVIVTFNNPKTGQKIIHTCTHDRVTDDFDHKIKFDPTPNEDDVLGLVGLLSEIFIQGLHGKDNTPESDCR